MKPSTCDRCGEPVVVSKSAVWNPTGHAKPLHAQTCAAPVPPKNPETVADVRRRHT